MKLDRLVGILSILLQKEQVTAPQLAERFEVSVRTILRDLDTLSQAGIPLVTRQGSGGGISILDGYKLDRTLLTNREMQDILAGLRSLDSVNGTNRYQCLMEKLSAGSSALVAGGASILIDLSSWNKKSLTNKIGLIRRTIETGKMLHFHYCGPTGESERMVESYYLLFRWSSWYLWGWCTKRQDWRLFKLDRMDGLTDTGLSFPKRLAPYPDVSNERVFPGGIHVRARFALDCKWRLVEEFGPACFTEEPDGQLLFEADYTNEENLISWVLTFGPKAELLEPVSIRNKLKTKLEEMRRRYE